MFQFILESLWLILPAGVANMAPVLIKDRLKYLAVPVDFNHKIGGKPIFGSHKTYRGFIVGTFTGIIIAFIQYLLYNYSSHIRDITLVPYNEVNFALIGFLLGFGALFGDTVKSFFKRRVKVAPGKKFFPWDQIDFVIGALVFISIVYVPHYTVVIFLIVFMPVLHILFNFLGYYLKFQKDKW